jgi:hypothetical protein
VFGHHRIVGAGAAEQAAVHQRVQGLDPAVHHFREAGDLGHVLDRQAGLADGLGGAAGGEHLDVASGEGAGQFDQAGLVGNGQQCPAHGQQVGGHGRRRCGRELRIISRRARRLPELASRVPRGAGPDPRASRFRRVHCHRPTPGSGVGEQGDADVQPTMP